MNLYNQLTAKEADIALILEGSYPFVKGGVSSWVHQLIQCFPHYRFALLFLGGLAENYKEGIKYTLPKNVVHLQVDFIFETDTPILEESEGNAQAFEKMRGIHCAFRNFDPSIIQALGDLSLYQKENGVDYPQFLTSKQSWKFISEEYKTHAADTSFIDYFWTIKNLHKPLWRIANIIPTIPKVKILHTISTGYAGFLGAMLHYHYQYPLILSEHGIYTKERRIDIFKSKMLYEAGDIDRSIREINYLHALWNRYFETMAKLCYESANPIISLFHAAHEMQIAEGAPAQKTQIIPNGVNIARFSRLRVPLYQKKTIIAFIGRVVAIKDVKNFIRSIVGVREAIPEIQAWIIGATDEEPEYVRECHYLVENLSLENNIIFKPHQDVDELYPLVKLLVLSSISESMPLVILESFAAGVPVVATDVGACHELVYGGSEEDKKIGAAGKVVKISNADELATATIEIMTHPELWENMRQAAITRCEKYYDEKEMIAKYTQLYEERI